MLKISDFEKEFKLQDKNFFELMNDFEFVKDLNRVMSERYQEVFNSFPKVKELNLIIENIKNFDYNDDKIEERLIVLKKFRSALILIEKNDSQIKPKKYEEVLDD